MPKDSGDMLALVKTLLNASGATHNPLVLGSNPSGPTTLFRLDTAALSQEPPLFRRQQPDHIAKIAFPGLPRLASFPANSCIIQVGDPNCCVGIHEEPHWQRHEIARGPDGLVDQANLRPGREPALISHEIRG